MCITTVKDRAVGMTAAVLGSARRRRTWRKVITAIREEILHMHQVSGHTAHAHDAGQHAGHLLEELHREDENQRSATTEPGSAEALR